MDAVRHARLQELKGRSGFDGAGLVIAILRDHFGDVPIKPRAETPTGHGTEYHVRVGRLNRGAPLRYYTGRTLYDCTVAALRENPAVFAEPDVTATLARLWKRG